MSKYCFTEKLGNAANEFEGDDLVELLNCVIDAAKESITQMHENFVDCKNERVTNRQIKMFG